MTEPKYLHDHLTPNKRRIHGPQSGRLVPCALKPIHGHHPENEACPDCLGWSETLPVVKAEWLDWAADEESDDDGQSGMWP